MNHNLTVISVLFFLFGCATERDVVGNSFQSSYPKMNIQISSQFKYLGGKTVVEYKKEYLEGRDLRTENEYYIFIPKNIKQRARKLIYIRIQTIPTGVHFINTSPDNDLNLNFGVSKINGENFYYFERLRNSSTGDSVTKYLLEEGFILPTCLMTNAFYTFPSNNMMVSINYEQDASKSGLSCKTKYLRDKLSEKQKNYIANFHEKALSAIGIVNEEQSQ